ncbi:hypothetical protein [Streptomyces albospinus]|nr:hypothetical protein [Streptomyces albospinus]
MSELPVLTKPGVQAYSSAFSTLTRENVFGGPLWGLMGIPR